MIREQATEGRSERAYHAHIACCPATVNPVMWVSVAYTEITTMGTTDRGATMRPTTGEDSDGLRRNFAVVEFRFAFEGSPLEGMSSEDLSLRAWLFNSSSREERTP